MKAFPPTAKHDWLNQSNSDFDSLLPLANRQTKLAKNLNEEQAVFRLYSLGVVTNRDEWVHDFNRDELGKKVRTFIDEYEAIRSEYGGRDVDNDVVGTTIKWTRDLKRQLRLDTPNEFSHNSSIETLYRPYTRMFMYYHQNLNEMQYQLPQVFPHGQPRQNKVLCFSGTSSSKPFSVLATDAVYSLDLLEKTQSLPLYRYTEGGRRVSNITQWGLRQFREHYGDESITAEQVFAYTYAVLHDPVYRRDYAVDLLREFPRLPLYHDFDVWARMGQELLDLHIGFESAEPYPLRREETGAPPGKPKLRADKERGVIVLDDATRLTGVPETAWRYRLGSRSALEWVFDQYRERKPRDPTIAARFDTYRFADHKERVIDLLRRVCAVSVRTMEIVDGMA